MERHQGNTATNEVIFISRLSKMTLCRMGYTMMELIIVIALLGLIMSIAVPDLFTYRDRLTLQSTAQELDSAIKLARQLSADEDREYVVELTSARFAVRENRVGSQRVVSQDYPSGIKRNAASHERLVVNRDGLTGYGKFILENSRKHRIDVEIHIGTGRVTISKVYSQ